MALYFLGTSASKKANPPAVSAHRAAPKPHRTTTHRANPPAPRRPKAVTLQLIPTGAVYVCLVDGHGKRLIPGVIYQPGQTIPTQTRQQAAAHPG